MPIYEYLCESCGSKFEKLVRRSEDAMQAGCPSCSGQNLKQEYSTFAAHAGSGGSSAPQQNVGCGGGMCASPGMCGRN